MEQQAQINPYLLLFLGTLGMLVLATGILVFFVTYQKRKLQEMLRMEQVHSRHQKELLQSVLHTQEQERQRIAADLHDEMGAALSAARLSLSRSLNEISPELSYYPMILQSRSILEEAIASTRQITYNLMPPSLKALGIGAAAESLFSRLSNGGNYTVFFENPVDVKCSEPIVELTFYRVIQELVNNTVKHSGASEITAFFEEEDGRIFFEYADNGKGFELNSQSGKGLGLKNIESRLQAIDAHAEYFSVKDRRTGLRISLPPEFITYEKDIRSNRR